MTRAPFDLAHHSAWCALRREAGSTCDCDFFEIEGRPACVCASAQAARLLLANMRGNEPPKER